MDKDLEYILKNYKPVFFQSDEKNRSELSHKNYQTKYNSNDFELKTIIVFDEYPAKRNKFYFDITKEKTMSILNSKIETEIYNDHNRLCMEWDKNVKIKHNKVRGDKDFFKFLDIEIDLTREQLKTQLYESTLNEAVYDFLEDKNPMFHCLSEKKQSLEMKKIINDQKLKEKFHKKITKTRIQKKYYRNYKNQIGENLGNLLENYLPWRQLFLIIDHKNKYFSFFTGSSTGSGARQYHGFGCHLFASLSNHKKITTNIIAFNSEGNVFSWHYDYFLFMDKDTIGNYQIDEKESKQILIKAKKIKDIKDIEFDCFIQTKEPLKWKGN